MSHNRTSVEDYQALKDDLNQLREDVVDLFGALKGEGVEKLSELKERVGSSVSKGASQAKETVKEHPFLTTAVAMSMGVVLGAIIARRRN